LFKIKVIASIILAIATIASNTPSALANGYRVEICEASWYGPGLQGNLMANGERFDMNDPTVAAHRDLPFGTELRVTNLDNGLETVVTVQDRGPFVPHRCIDLSRAAAQNIEMVCGARCGTASVRVEVIETPSS
jgi:rare lipoprotein A